MKAKRQYNYDIFYELFGEICTGTAIGANRSEAIADFKKVYGEHPIVCVQRLSY